MVSTGPGLGDVLGAALSGWRPRAAEGRGGFFGAAGRRGAEPDREMASLVQSASPPDQPAPAFLEPDPFARMFSTEVGRRAANAVGNETMTLAALERLSLEIMADALRSTGQAREAQRLLVVPGGQGRPPVLMLMSPDVANGLESRIISDRADLPLAVLWKSIYEAADPEVKSPEVAALQQVLQGGPAALAEVFLISQPEIVLARRPRMTPLCVPAPHMKVEAGGQVSTAGILCRDKEGELGVTACHHGTGPAGTIVQVDGRERRVKSASPVQDIVFIPLGDGFNLPELAGLGGVRADREPARSDWARFDGVINQNRRTRVISTDAGMLRPRPTIMLKLQTDPDTDQGDSGSALLDEQDKVLGFAFERTSYDDHPQFTDWIWAANALRALQLNPHR